MGPCREMVCGETINTRNMLEDGRTIKPMGMASIQLKKVTTKVTIH